MRPEIDILNDFLRQKKLKFTRQRENIFRTFLGIQRHMSVDELHDAIKKAHPGIGQATVFRTLKLLCEADIAKEVNLGGKKSRYEPKYGHKHHDHLVCVECGECIEAVDPKIESLQDKLCRKYGFAPEQHKLEIFGMCKKCRPKTRRI